MASKSKPEKSQVVGLLGVGLDNTDEHQRITRSEEILLVGGSRETHEHMQDMAMRLAEELRERGKRLQDTTPAEVIDLLHKAAEH